VKDQRRTRASLRMLYRAGVGRKRHQRAVLRATAPHSGIGMRVLSCTGVQGCWTVGSVHGAVRVQDGILRCRDVVVCEGARLRDVHRLQQRGKVTSVGIADVHVQLNGSDGVIVPYRVGASTARLS
jgi:hypothetical protein